VVFSHHQSLEIHQAYQQSQPFDLQYFQYSQPISLSEQLSMFYSKNKLLPHHQSLQAYLQNLPSNQLFLQPYSVDFIDPYT
jgi:hypothetical protein